MLLHIPEVFSKAEVQALRARLDAGPWADGNATSGHQSALTKKNQQLPTTSAEAIEIGGVVSQALNANPMFVAAALPHTIFPPLFNRYEGGEEFGLHVDNAVRQGAGVRIRSDLSMTLFLSEPDSYDGGELVVSDTYGEHEVKLPAGDLIVYPSDSLHRVEPVTRGARFAAFFWVQSLVRDAQRRRLLLELDGGIQQLAASGADRDALLRLTGVYHNLLRQWSET